MRSGAADGDIFTPLAQLPERIQTYAAAAFGAAQPVWAADIWAV